VTNLPKPDRKTLHGLTIKIHTPILQNPAKRPKPQKSWATLKVGDVLEHDAVRHVVTACDSHGVSLGSGLRLEDRDWREKGWRKLSRKEIDASS
jgi:hypothetical protein